MNQLCFGNLNCKLVWVRVMNSDATYSNEKCYEKEAQWTPGCPINLLVGKIRPGNDVFMAQEGGPINLGPPWTQKNHIFEKISV